MSGKILKGYCFSLERHQGRASSVWFNKGGATGDPLRCVGFVLREDEDGYDAWSQTDGAAERVGFSVATMDEAIDLVIQASGVMRRNPDESECSDGEQTPLQMLKEINDLLESGSDEQDNDRAIHKRGFLEGRAFEITRKMDRHPEWWDSACCCGECSEC